MLQLRIFLAETWPVLFAAAFLLFCLPAWAWYRANRRRCPACSHHRLIHLDDNVFYDPRPDRSLHHCTRCGADFARHRRRWVTRREWADADDQALWTELLRKRIGDQR